ncbi:melanocortin-2 receptor accessory protein 2 isoform X2 [Motacilla alba alba]|nr:melanocortin-2 receptor accessory protein 2 isoform X2 [Motacilla alba alba]
MNSFVADFGRPLESERVFSHQMGEESQSLFHFCINEVDHMNKEKESQKGPSLESNLESNTHFQEVPKSSGMFEEDLHCLTKFNIPNFVNTEQNSSLGEDDLLISEPTIIL